MQKKSVMELIDSPEVFENDRTGVSGEVRRWKKISQSIRQYNKHLFIIARTIRNNMEW